MQYEILKRAALYWGCVVFDNTILKRLGADDLELRGQTLQTAASILCTLDVAVSTKPFGSTFVTFGGFVAYGVLEGSQCQRIKKSVSSMFDELKVEVSEAMLQSMFDSFIGGPIETTQGLETGSLTFAGGKSAMALIMLTTDVRSTGLWCFKEKFL